MNDERHPCGVDFGWDVFSEKWANDEVGLCQLGSLDHEFWRECVLDRDGMAILSEHQSGSLREERMVQKRMKKQTMGEYR